MGVDGNALLAELGEQLGAAEPVAATRNKGEVASQLAERLDRLGHEAIATSRGGDAQVEAFHCVFHALAQRNPDLCRFDLAFMEAATGHRIHPMEGIVRGGQLCRFKAGEPRG